MGNFIKIYLWQVISILFNFAALFIVTPFLSSNPPLYGIYTIVISAYLFIAYADFGFLSAGMKYAAESFALKKQKEEIEIIGFSGFIFLCFVILYALVIIIVSFKPEILIEGLKSASERAIATKLLLILAIFSPVFVFQRIIQIIFGVRLQDYKFQRILIISNIIKISSTFYFFRNGNYQIVEYFLFSQLCILGAVIAGIILSKKQLNYDILFLFKSLKFSKAIYLKTKKLAFTSIFLTISWILYYEMDPFIIGKFLGTNSVAIYAIGLTLISYFRSLFGILFTPFVAKFNHFVGLQDKVGLQNYFVKVLIIFLPLTVFPVLSTFLSINSFILSWVGSQYSSSIVIAKILVLSYIFSFITSPSGILIMANERVKALFITSTLQPIIFWLGVICTFNSFGLAAFAYFKFIALLLESIIYLFIITKFLEINIIHIFKQIMIPSFIPIIFIIVTYLLLKNQFPLQQNKLNLVKYCVLNMTCIFLGLISYYFTSSVFREFINKTYNNFKIKLLKTTINAKT